MNIGIIGTGQLGRMLALSGYPLGFNFGFLGEKNSPCGGLGEIFDRSFRLPKYGDVFYRDGGQGTLQDFLQLTL